MDLIKTGKLISTMRCENGLTQKNVADMLGVCAKTVSKWETGRGFPDISLVSELSKIFKIDILSLITGEMPVVKRKSGNLRKINFYVCECCGNILTSTDNTEIICCGRKIFPLGINEPDDIHNINVEKIDNDFYITLTHPMTKEHYISFVCYVCSEKMMMVKLYPEQGAEVRIPIMYGGKFYCYCNHHGLYEYNIK